MRASICLYMNCPGDTRLTVDFAMKYLDLFSHLYSKSVDLNRIGSRINTQYGEVICGRKTGRSSLLLNIAMQLETDVERIQYLKQCD